MRAVGLAYRNFFQTEESSDAVLQMDDQIAFRQLAEIDLGAMALCASQPQKPTRMDCESSEQFRSREHNEIRCGKTKSARERPLDEVQALDHATHDFAETFDLAFGLKINENPGVVSAPFIQPLDELCAFCLCQHQIARTKLPDVAILKRAAEVFRTSFNPAFTDLNVRA